MTIDRLTNQFSRNCDRDFATTQQTSMVSPSLARLGNGQLAGLSLAANWRSLRHFYRRIFVAKNQCGNRRADLRSVPGTLSPPGNPRCGFCRGNRAVTATLGVIFSRRTVVSVDPNCLSGLGGNVSGNGSPIATTAGGGKVYGTIDSGPCFRSTCCGSRYQRCRDSRTIFRVARRSSQVPM